MARFNGTNGDDDYTLRAGTREVVLFGDGGDTLHMAAGALDAGDRVRGGGGFDTAYLDDGGTYVLGDRQVTQIETLILRGHGDFDLTIDDTVGARGTTLSIFVDSSILEKQHPSSLRFDGSAERNADIYIYGSDGDDVMVTGAGDDTFHGQTGDDTMTGGRGADLYYFIAHNQKGDIWGEDVITDFKPGQDHLTFQTYAADSFDDLLITDGPDGAVIRTVGSESSVTLNGVFAHELDADDISFLGVHGQVPPHVEAPGHGVLA